MDQIEVSRGDTVIAPLALPAAILAYVAKFTPGAIYIVCGSSGFPCVIGSGTDLGAELVAIRKTWPAEVYPPVLAAAWWAHDVRAAQEVMNLAIGCDLRGCSKEGSRLAVTITEAQTAILAAAKRLSIGLTPHATMLERAAAAVTQIDSTIKAATDAGQLKFSNLEYQKRRREAAAEGREFISYAVATKRLREVLAGIAHDRATGAKLNAAIIEQVFGKPGSKALWKR